jgi:small-conductance mechanosensitive channel
MSLLNMIQSVTKPTGPIGALNANATIENAQNLENLALRTYRVAEQWMVNHWLELVIALVTGFVIYAALSYIKRHARGRADRHDGPVDLTYIALRVIGRTGRIFRIMVAIMLVAGYANTPTKLYGLIVIAFTIVAVLQVAVWVRELILGLIERKANAGDGANEGLENAMTLIRLLVSVAVFAVAFIVILDNLGVNVTGLVAGLGIGGIAIGLAAQGIFSDLFAALSILFDKPFKRGEVIHFDTMTATVEKIGLKSTRLRALDGQEVIVSNTQLLSKQIDNMTQLHRRRSRYVLALVYHTPPEKLRALPDKLQAIVEGKGAEFIRANFTAFGASSIDFEVIFDVLSGEVDINHAHRHAIAMEIIELFTRDGYQFAYPTQTTFTAAPDGTMVMPYMVPK